ncbi:globin family protein [Tepidicaulis sp.]|uniref:globin family protein n=1 Tax=Tepidicaulis sp. TaxID=1920809 RepID=UPI003B5B854C
MTPQERTLVQESFAAVRPISDQAAAMFYDRLFTIAPEVKPLFKGDISEQGKKLMQMLAVAVNGLNNLEAILPAVQELGRKHVDYGVTAAHYQPVGEALLWTLEQGLGDAFTAETKAAWEKTYTLLAGAMIEAAEGAKA